MKNWRSTLGWTAVAAFAGLATPSLAQSAAMDAGAAAVEVVTPAAPEETAEAELFSLEEELKIVSASQQEEPLKEAPAPVTVITAEMIKALGPSATLEDVVNTYVPGFTYVMDHNERQLATRGVYSSAQQKVLVMRDGHRLNSRAYSQAAPDHGITLEGVKQIEVVRGPGSSVWGNVALAAVINLVSKSGKEIDGVTLKLGAGNFGIGDKGEFLIDQHTASIVAGKSFGDKGDFTFAGQYYYSSYEEVPVSASSSGLDKCFCSVPKDGVAYVGGQKDSAPYDIFARYTLGPFTAMYENRAGRTIDPLTSSGATGEPYDYNALRKFRGLTPGWSGAWQSFDLKFAPKITERLSLDVTAYYDTYEHQHVLSTNGDTQSALYLGWVENDIGTIIQGRYDYDFGKFLRGNITLGGQFDRMQLTDSILPSMTGNEWTKFNDTQAAHVLETGQPEFIYSAYLQIKHRILDNLIVNAGLRYDHKVRHEGAPVDDLSPRIALIFSPATWVDLKLSYGRSFVDAPYWYRYNSLASYKGSRGLLPEHLQSVQATGAFTFLDGKLRNTVNFFYNDLSDFVYRDNASCADPVNPICYKNAGVLKSVGLEEELALVQEWYRIHFNFTLQMVTEGRDYGTTGNQIWNVPPFVSNLVAEVNPFTKWTKKTWLTAQLRYTSPQISHISVPFKDAGGNLIYPNEDVGVPGHLMVNLALRLTDLGVPGLGVDAVVNNLFAHRTYQGGSMTHPYPQPGRWYLLTVSYKLPF